VGYRLLQRKTEAALYSISDEQLRPYFPENKAVNGLFEVVKRIYGITAKERTDIDVWHPDVRFFELYDEKTSCAAASISISTRVRTSAAGRGWTTAWARCVKRRFPAKAGRLPDL
jgi:oligopeptidase A